MKNGNVNDSDAGEASGAPLKKFTDQNQEREVSRRGVAKAGFALPVLMSLTSRPVWAQGTKIVCSPSALASGNVSQTSEPEACTVGLGYSTATWFNTPTEGQATALTPTWRGYRQTNFFQEFGFGPDKSFSQILGDGVAEDFDQLIAMYLNIKYLDTGYAVSADDFGDMVAAVVGGTHYEAIDPLTASDIAWLGQNLNTRTI